MRTVETLAQLRALLDAAPGPIGLVPTMGYLHDGHLSLIRRCRAECATAVVSIFVNPTQFGPGEDFTTYPRDMARDLSLSDADGVDVAFCPSAEEMYPPGFSTYVEVGGVSERWEGASRPGHFRGVATIVARLLRAVRPARAYFGEKDYQQLQVVRRLASDLLLDVEIVPCTTVRESDGLALSSRNVQLGPEARRHALALSRSLEAAQRAAAEGIRDGEALGAIMHQTLTAEGAVDVDYAAVVDPTTLEPLRVIATDARALVAARVGGVRLIDNASVSVPSPDGAGHEAPPGLIVPLPGTSPREGAGIPLL